MAYDTNSPGTAGVRYPASMDQDIITHVASMTELSSAAEIRAWFLAADNRELSGDPWSSALGCLQSDVRALLGIIDRQRETITSLRDQIEDQADEGKSDLTTVPMVCTACRKPVIPSGNYDWIHADCAAIFSCPRLAGQPVKAMVAAGNESVPRA